MSEDSKRSSEVQSLRRAISILRAFTSETTELGVTELSQHVGLHKSTTYRLLSTLIAEGLIAQNPETGRYRLGLGLIELASGVETYSALRQVVRPYMRGLAENTRGTVNVAVLDAQESFNLEQAVPRGFLVVNHGWVGRRTPLHATSTGKVLLAWLPPEEITDTLGDTLPAYTQNTITDIQVLLAELDCVREAGYALGHEEYEIGLNAVAAPVRSQAGAVMAALSVSGPAYRLAADGLDKVAETVIATAEEISAELGYTVPESLFDQNS